MRNATQAKLDFMATELPRFTDIGAWERGSCDKWVSRMYLKPGTNKWRFIIDLRELHKWCNTLKMSYETLKHMRHMTRGFWQEDDRAHHITWKELRAVRHAVGSFLPQLRGRRVLLHEDNTAVVASQTNLTSRSPVMMEELRKLWHLLDIHDISIRPRYIQSAANVWADRLSRELDDADWQLNPRIFAYLQRLQLTLPDCGGKALDEQLTLQHELVEEWQDETANDTARFNI
eukprot:jgi/Tetstr1/425009/TSEL_015477.t1